MSARRGIASHDELSDADLAPLREIENIVSILFRRRQGIGRASQVTLASKNSTTPGPMA